MIRISAKTEYACKAIIELCVHGSETEPMQMSVVAQNQKIPQRFLTQIMLNLKQLGIIQSIRGKTGGYILLKKPDEIYLSEIIEHFEGNEIGFRSKQNHVMDSIWQEVKDAFLKTIENINFETIINKQRQLDRVVNFVI